MQESVLEFLHCPVCKGRLELEIIQTIKKRFTTGDRIIIESGILFCSCHLLFPIVETVPRMLIESFTEHDDFLRQHVPDFFRLKKNLLEKYGDLVSAARKRNQRSKASFSLEWNLLKGKKEINVWHLSREQYKTQLFDELDLPDQFLENKLTIDVGCGHGLSTIFLGKRCESAFGIDLGSSVVKANADNISENCHFIQADLHYSPFVNNSFDIVYSSGVLHHTPDTENAFRIVSDLVTKGGIYCVWLYKSYHNPMHKMTTWLRKITTHLPLRVQFWIYLIFFVPIHKFIAWMRRNKPKPRREIMIELFDSFSPPYRFEHEPEEVRVWFDKNGFTNVQITTVNDIGFSMKGSR